MVIEHHDHKMSVGGSGKNLTFIAFYADCHHEIRPMKQGYRVVLTYNLIVKDGLSAATTNAAQLEALAPRVRDFLDTPSPPRWDGDHRQAPPDRLVYLLDHQYTQRGLAWNRLKNGDAARATALREVAHQLDCEIFSHWRRYTRRGRAKTRFLTTVAMGVDGAATTKMRMGNHLKRQN